jgi:hypothetical protein
MRQLILALLILLCPLLSVARQINVDIGFSGIDIGINMPIYPELIQVPGYPVYYDPRATSNYFFYDGQYWVYQDNNWYSGDWYNGPWQLVGPEYVPLFVLRVPVRYYGAPPVYFHGWSVDVAPRWGEHWGEEWARRHDGWDHWDNRSTASVAPLPIYQRQYAGDHYPQPTQQQLIRSENGGQNKPAPRETAIGIKNEERGHNRP